MLVNERFGLERCQIEELSIDVGQAMQKYVCADSVSDMFLLSRLISTGLVTYTFSVWDINGIECKLKHLEILEEKEYWHKIKDMDSDPEIVWN